jgi:hypothetical protein
MPAFLVSANCACNGTESWNMIWMANGPIVKRAGNGMQASAVETA